MVNWRKIVAFLGVIGLSVACVVTGSDLSDNVKEIVLAGIAAFGVGNYMEHKLKNADNGKKRNDA